MAWRAGLRPNDSTDNACLRFGCGEGARSKVVFTARRTVFGAFLAASKCGRPICCSRVYDFRMSFVKVLREVQNGKHGHTEFISGPIWVLGGARGRGKINSV